MQKIGGLVVFRLPKRDDGAVEALASATATTKAALLRAIIDSYLTNPGELSEEFKSRIGLAIAMREAPLVGEKVRVGVTLPDEMKNTLDLLSDHTGATIEALIGIMIRGHLLKCRNEGLLKP